MVKFIDRPEAILFLTSPSTKEKMGKKFREKREQEKKLNLNKMPTLKRVLFREK